MADERIIIEVDADTGKVIKAFKGIEKKAEKSGENIGEDLGSGVTKGFKVATVGLAAAAAAAAAAVGAALFTKASIETAAQFEQINTQLQILTGSAEKANEVFEELKEFSAQTPFQLKDIAEASAKLISFGFSAGEVRNRLKEIGEVAAGSGSNLQEISLIFGQVAAAGKLTGERLLQLQERAIPIGPAIAKTLGIAESKVRDFVSQGKVTADVFQAAFQSMSTEGGIFAGALAKQSQTINGSLSTLQDNFELLKGEFGKAFGPSVVKAAQGLSKAFQEVAEKFKDPEFQRSVGIFASAMANAVIFTAKLGAKLATSVGPTLGDLDKKIERFSGRLAVVNKEIAESGGSEGSFFRGVLSGFKNSSDEAKNLTDKLFDLEQRRAALINQAPNIIRSLKEVGEVENEQAEKRKAEAERQKQSQEEALAGLGNIGLTKTQLLEEQLAKELSLIQIAEETKAITEDEANARRVQRLQEINGQLTAIQEQEDAKRQASAKARIEQELAAEQTLGQVLGNVGKRFQLLGKQFKITSKDIAKALVQGVGQAAGSAFASLGKAIATGENALEAFGKALLAAFGQSLVSLGTGFILQGVAQSLAGFGSGAPLIAAGAALATFGGVLSGIAGGGGGATATGGGVASGSGGDFSGGTESSVVEQEEEREEPSTQVSVTIQGDVLDSEESGTRIVGILNDAFEKDGVVVRGAAFA